MPNVRVGSFGTRRPSGAYNYAALCFADGDEADGMAALRRATERGHPVAPADLGGKLLKNGNETEAEKFLLQAPVHHPKAGALASFYLGMIATAAGNSKGPSRTINRRPSSTSPRSPERPRSVKGTILGELGDRSAAVNAYTRGAELGSAKAEAKLTKPLACSPSY